MLGLGLDLGDRIPHRRHARRSDPNLKWMHVADRLFASIGCALVAYEVSYGESGEAICANNPPPNTNLNPRLDANPNPNPDTPHRTLSLRWTAR